MNGTNFASVLSLLRKTITRVHKRTVTLAQFDITQILEKIALIVITLLIFTTNNILVTISIYFLIYSY